MSKVTLSEDVLTGQGEPFYDQETGELAGWETDPHFLVSATTGDHEALLPALWAACGRFSFIDETGRELDEWELDGSTYTPNFVFDPYVFPSGIVLLADTKGYLSQEMGEAMLRVLTEELSALGVDAHIAVAGDGIDLEAGVAAPAPAADAGSNLEGAGEPEPERFWFMCRTVWTETTQGRRYQDCEYRREDGTWTRNKAEGQRWTAEERAAMTALAHQLRAGEDREYRTTYGEATGILLKLDPTSEPWPMPPPGLRDPGPEA